MEILTVQRGYTEKTKQFFSNGFNTWERVFAKKSETCFCSSENTLMFVTVWSISLALVQSKHQPSRTRSEQSSKPAVLSGLVYTEDSILLFKREIGPIKSQSSPEKSFWSPVPGPVLPSIFVGVCPSSEMSEMRPKLNRWQKYSENSNFTATPRVPEDWKDICFQIKFYHKNCQ